MNVKHKHIEQGLRLEEGEITGNLTDRSLIGYRVCEGVILRNKDIINKWPYI